MKIIYFWVSIISLLFALGLKWVSIESTIMPLVLAGIGIVSFILGIYSE